MHAKVLDLEDEKRVMQAQNSSLTQEHRTMEQELQLSEQARRSDPKTHNLAPTSTHRGPFTDTPWPLH